MESIFANRPEYGKGFWWRTVLFSIGIGFAFLETTHLFIGAFLTKEQEQANEALLVKITLASFLVPIVVSFLVMMAMKASRGRRAADLFGRAPAGADAGRGGREIRIVVSSYFHVKAFDAKVDERFYKVDKKESGDKRFVRGSREAVVGLMTMRSAIYASEQALKLGRFQVMVAGDTDPAPADATTFICLGSPGTNDLARGVFEEEGLGLSSLYRFDAHGNLYGGNPTETLPATAALDYAVLTKLTRGEHIYFVCAGVDEEGTIASVTYLLEGWQNLWKKVGARDFHLALTVEKNRVPKIEACTLRGSIWAKDAKEKLFNPLPA